MGFTVKLSALRVDDFNKLLTPVVFCVDEKKASSFTKDYSVLSVNGLLSEKLIRIEESKRNIFAADEMNKLIAGSNEPVLIKDFEILFDPEYQIDVLKLFILANRKKRIAVLWCGTYKDGKLFFAEPGYKDYHVYNISDYDISCII